MQTLIVFIKNTIFDIPVKWQLLFQEPASAAMENIIDLHHDIVFFLILVIIFTFWIIFRIILFFQHSSEYANFFKLTHHTNIEIIWTFVPAGILFLISLPSLALLYTSDECVNVDITLKVIGHQWYWSYEFGDFLNKDYAPFFNEVFDSYMISNSTYLRMLETDRVLILPVNSYIRLLITSTDVIHSWAIPSLGIKLDAIPGRLNQVITYIDRSSVFYGQCSEIRGINHSFMPISVLSVNSVKFYSWLNSNVNISLLNSIALNSFFSTAFLIK